MDTKNLKHRKRQKKSKSGVDKQNNDVLVVPPDILKKLGISIGNTNFIHQITNNNNTGQNTEIVNNEATASVPIPINNEKTNESSILETANLMKKSVFLSPTFIPTVANTIPGEVEISNTKTDDDSGTERQNLALESIVKKINSEPRYKQQSIQKGRQIENNVAINEGTNTKEEASGMSEINGIVKLDKNNCVGYLKKALNPYNDCFKELSMKMVDNIECAATKINCDNLTINGACPSDIKITDEFSRVKTKNSLISYKRNIISNGQSEDDDNNVSLDRSEMQIEIAQLKNYSISLEVSGFYSEKHNLENNLISIEKHADNNDKIQTEVPESENNLIHLKESTMQIEETEIDNNLVSLEGFQIKIGQAEVENNLIPLEGLQVDQDFHNNLVTLEDLAEAAIELEKAEVDNNIVYLEKCKLIPEEVSDIQIESVIDNNLNCLKGSEILIEEAGAENNLILLEDSAKNIKMERVDKNPFSLEGCGRDIDESKDENNLISIEDRQKEQADVDNNLISLEQHEIQREEAEAKNNIISLKEGVFLSEQVEKESNSYDLKEIAALIEHAEVENNIISLKDNLNLIDQVSQFPNNSISMEANMIENVYGDLRDISINDCKHIFPETNVDSALPMNGIDSFENINGQIFKGDIVVQTQESDMEVEEEIVKNNIFFDDSKKAQDLCNGYSNNSSIQNDANLKSGRNPKNCDKTLNKIVQKVNIISEEIIPASDFKELKRSNSPIIKSLTPVPLTTIIAPKKPDTKTEKNKSKLKSAPNLVPLPSKNVNTTLAIKTSKNVINEQNCKESCKEVLNDQTLDKGDLKNNNDTFAFAGTEIEALTNDHGVENKSSITNNSSLVDLPTSASVDKRCEDKEINDTSRITEGISKENYYQNDNCLEAMADKNDNMTVFKNKIADVNLSKNDIKSNQESITEKKQVIEKKRKKKRKATESKDTVVNSTEDKAFCETQINNILKSTKDNNDANAHLDKVKEIAEYIKKYAHIYKDNKRGINKHVKKETANNKNNINSKSNMIKSKLCIQGVEKPGGNKVKREISGETKVLKTYTRQNKQQKTRPIPTADSTETVACNIVDATETELSTIDISTSYKTQDFCLCCDFGRLDACDYDNSYEHIHFWLRNDNTDLESILSIYNDDVGTTDRTELDDIKVCEVIEDNARANNICWNYFLNDQDGGKDVKISNPLQKLDDSVIGESSKGVATDNQEIKDIINPVQANDSVQQYNNSNENNDSETATNNNTLDVNDVNINKSDSDESYDIITIVEMEDCEDGSNILETIESNSTLKTAIEENVLDQNDASENTKQMPQQSQQSKEGSKSESSKDVKDKKVAFETTDNKEEEGGDTNKTNDADKLVVPETNEPGNPKENSALSVPESSKQSSRKRKLPVNDTSEPSTKKGVKCGVCDKLLSEEKWERHVSNTHSYIAWKAGQSFDFEDPDLIKKLQQKLETVGSLKCTTCTMHTKKFNKYIAHVKVCSQHKESRRGSLSRDRVKCGVCHVDVKFTSWHEHIGREHNYLAWIDGKEVLNIEDEAEVSKHLQTISRGNGGLICYKCGMNRKRVKHYLSHIENCDGTQVHLDDSTISVEVDPMRSQEEVEPSTSDKKTLTCGVCKQEVAVAQWTVHIAKEHNYLAWEDGTTPLNMDDEEAVWNHLQEFIRQCGGLMCHKCGLKRKRVKMYLSHIKTCDGQGVNLDESAIEDVSINKDSSDEKKFECGVCHAKVTVLEWNEHIGREHNYLAWKVGATPLDVNDEDAVKEHLLEIIRSCEGLICYKCGLNRRRVKLYLAHVQTCDGTQNRHDTSTVSSNSMLEVSIDLSDKVVECGVCAQQVAESLWVEHIGREHQYLAWKHGQEPLDVEDEDAVKDHLQIISKHNNGLICNKCQVPKKYPKTFLQHIKECTGIPTLEESKLRNEYEFNIFDISDVTSATVKCGACGNVVKTDEWMTHMESEHNYLAWLDGKQPLNVKDAAMVQKHLTEVSKRTNGLKCGKCGLVRKYVKAYLHHFTNCGREPAVKSVVNNSNGLVECAVCHEEVDLNDWRDHAMKKHYNVAWIVGSTPIEINNPYGVEPYIKEYQLRHHNKLVCKTCGINRVSAVGFYAHIITCGKTEEEQEIYKSLCEVCNNKYLRIYKSQHMTAHREKEYAIERKLLLKKEKELKKEENDAPVEIVGGRRKAAERAKTVIEKYSSNIVDGSHCSLCGFTSEVESEMANHVCVEKMYEGTDSDESVNLNHSTDDDDDTDIDSNISDEEREARDRERTKSKKHGDSACKIQRLPYQIKNINGYMRKCAEEFAALHLTDKDLFSEWRCFEYDMLSEAELSKYMPPLEESCKVRHGDNDTWKTYKRFEAKKEHEILTMFTGACIQCICWVPPYIGECDVGSVREYISVVTHLSSDVPRHFWHDQPVSKPALLQIWDCGNIVRDVPEFAMGLALDCGTIWAIDWCPSGARDVFDPEGVTSEIYRLGLIAIASTNGSAYIFSVPHPFTLKDKDLRFFKLKPVAELRLAMCSNRKTYQATAIKWSTQKDHAHIVVGYADGTTAHFDLRNESPLLKSTENNVSVFYPYFDERSQSMCIEDVDVFPVRSAGTGVAVAGSVGGAGTRHVQAHAAAARVLFPPHWPAALLAGDDNLVSQAINEVEWYGVGRRMGGMRACCACAWCGRVAAVSAPLVRVLRTHPAYTDLHRQIIATIQMVPFGNKRKRKNDELSMIMEPLTYDDAIVKYGIDIKQITAKDKNTQQKLSGIPREAYPERFPLSDVTSMLFCPSAKNHNKLAIATHSGHLFIINA